jgi:hypothetical protein
VRPRGVIDGKQVNIPVPMFTAMEGRRKLGQLADGCKFKRLGRDLRQIRDLNAEAL